MFSWLNSSRFLVPELITSFLSATLSSFVTAYIVNHQRDKQLLQHEIIPAEVAEKIESEFKPILESFIAQMKGLDLAGQNKLGLSEVLLASNSQIGGLEKKADGWYELHRFLDHQRSGRDIATSPPKQMIFELFNSYFQNRNQINDENRIFAVTVVRIISQVCSMFDQFIHLLALLPGEDNENRLVRCKEFIVNFIKNLLENETLMGTYKKNAKHLFVDGTQRRVLVKAIEPHFINTIDELIQQQRTISLCEASAQATKNYRLFADYLSEFFARLFSSEAAKERSRLTNYKITKDILRADTGKNEGIQTLTEKGIFVFLKPLAQLAEILGPASREENNFYLVIYHQLFSSTEVTAWQSENKFNQLNRDELAQLSKHILEIFKLLFISHALEKDFLKNIEKYGYQGFIEREDLNIKRHAIDLTYLKMIEKLKNLIAHPSIARMVSQFSNPTWLKAQAIPPTSGHSFLTEHKSIGHSTILSEPANQVVNTSFYECIGLLELMHQSISTAQDAIRKQFHAQQEINGANSSAIKLANKEVNQFLVTLNSILVESNINLEKNVFPSFDNVRNQIFTIEKYIANLSGQLKINNKNICFNEERSPIDESTYQNLIRLSGEYYYWQDDRLFIKPLPKRSMNQLRTYQNQLLLLEMQLKKPNQGFTQLPSFLQSLTNITQSINALFPLTDLEEQYSSARIECLERNTQLQLSQINQLTCELQQNRISYAALNDLEISNRENLETTERVKKINQAARDKMLLHFKVDYQHLLAFKESTTGQIKIIRGLLAKTTNGNEELAKTHLEKLKKEIVEEIDKILGRLKDFEFFFTESNNMLVKEFDQLQQSIIKEKNQIDSLRAEIRLLEAELNTAHLHLNRIQKHHNHPHYVVNNFPDLLAYLDRTLEPKLSFFSSYRGVKTENILSYIQLILSNYQSLRQTLPTNEDEFIKTLTPILDKSTLINRTRPLMKSTSKHLMVHIARLFYQGNLLSTLQNQGIAYHDKLIKYDQDKLHYQQTTIACSVQP